MLQTPHLIAPREKPDGTVSWEEQEPDLAERIRKGDANIGWLGDERLSLHLNLKYQPDPDEHPEIVLPRWEVWRRHDDGTSSVVCHFVGQRPSADSLIRGLARNDSRTRNIAVEMLEARGAREAREIAAFAEHCEDKADKLHFALSKDLGEPFASGRIVRLGGR
jgi:hypothetical protein